tara:strand:+ start:482 stop:1039 length:558 start_codon:yes stop_codon:yes gene_type:complete
MKTLFFLLLPFYASGFSRLTSITSSFTSKPVIVGSTKPLENFDPLNFGEDEDKMLYNREAELKHGRIGMIAATTIPIVEQFTHRPAIHEFEKLPDSMQIGLVSLMFISEFSSMIRGWKNPFEGESNYFKLQEYYQPGDLGFMLDYDLNSDKGKEFLNKELNNGRLAMIATLGMIVQELVTNKPLI